MTANNITPCAGSRLAVKGNKIAASVSILTPGIAPNNMPPTTPKTKMPIVKGSPKRAAEPAKKFSIIAL
jgi:hypothetical protein